MKQNNEIDELKNFKTSNNIKDFSKLLSKFIPSLRNYIRTKLKIAEIKKKIPKDMFTPDDILDEVYIKIFNEFGDQYNDVNSLKLRLFTYANEILSDKIKMENWQARKISIEDIMKRELESLDEEFTVDADGDFVMLEELDDISYKQDEYKSNLIILAKSEEEELIKSLDLEGKGISEDLEKRKALGQLYAELGELSRSVLDLYAFGILSVEEIAEIQNMQVDDVKKLITKIKVRFQTSIL